MELQLFDANWWANDSLVWIGYFPGSLFDVIDDEPCRVHWYDDVYSSGRSTWNGDNMGSGLLSSQGLGRAAAS